MIQEAKLRAALDEAYEKIMNNLELFESKVPAAVSQDYVYPAVENRDWTDGFWLGMLHLAQEYRPDSRLERVIELQLAVFQERLDQEIVLAHHDLGFLYSLSAVADFRLNHRESSRQMAIQAADVLMRRYHPVARIFQAWGDPADPEQQGRMIIDCNMNLALLYFASEQTGDAKYRVAAQNHVKQAQRYLVRPDFSTFHTFYMDTQTGRPRFGKTAQGFSDDSCWARGQAWGIYGFPISYNHTGDATLLATAQDLADYFIKHLPPDLLPYWDLCFTASDQEERDSSAGAITVCGLLELSKNLPLSNPKRSDYERLAAAMLERLIDSCTTRDYPKSNGLLTQGVYSKPNQLGVNECTLWGDYFYFEALIRLNQAWYSFW